MAVNGTEALIKTQELQPDLVILDLAMPVMNGLEAAREIAKVQPNTHVLLKPPTWVFAKWWNEHSKELARGHSETSFRRRGICLRPAAKQQILARQYRAPQ